MYKIGILTNNIKKDFHSAELFEQASQRAKSYILRPQDLELEINSGTNVVKAGQVNVYDLDALIIRRLDQRADSDFQFDLLSQLQQSGVLVINSCQSLQVAESKALSNYLLASYGFPVIDFIVTQETDKALEYASRFEDVVIKTLYGQLGQELYRFSELSEPKAEIARLIEQFGSVMVQRYIESNGKDFRVFVVNDHVSAAIERHSEGGWKSNISQGATAKKIILKKDLRDMAVKATQIMGLDYCGIDMISEKGKTYFLELNGSPSWIGVQEATGKKIADEIISAVIKKIRYRAMLGHRISS